MTRHHWTGCILPALLLVFVWWQWDGPAYQDTLEGSADLASWSDVPGPYSYVNGWVIAEQASSKPSQFYRVRRNWASTSSQASQPREGVSKPRAGMAGLALRAGGS